MVPLEWYLFAVPLYSPDLRGQAGAATSDLRMSAESGISFSRRFPRPGGGVYLLPIVSG